jgi:hypothetical protein
VTFEIGSRRKGTQTWWWAVVAVVVMEGDDAGKYTAKK